MAHIKVQRRSMRPEEFVQLRYGWLKRHIYEEKREITTLQIRDARQTAEETYEYYSEDYRPLKKGRMGIWSVGLYNAYCRMNPVLVRKEYEYGGRAFKTLGFLPVVPSVSYTYKF